MIKKPEKPEGLKIEVISETFGVRGSRSKQGLRMETIQDLENDLQKAKELLKRALDEHIEGSCHVFCTSHVPNKCDYCPFTELEREIKEFLNE